MALVENITQVAHLVSSLNLEGMIKVQFTGYVQVYLCEDIVVVMKVFNSHHKGKLGLYKGAIMEFSCILVLLIELWIMFLNIPLLWPYYNSRHLFLPPLGSFALD